MGQGPQLDRVERGRRGEQLAPPVPHQHAPVEPDVELDLLAGPAAAARPGRQLQGRGPGPEAGAVQSAEVASLGPLQAKAGADYHVAMANVSSEPVVRVRGLRKSYGEVEAVRGIDLDVNQGEVFALLGPNGAGKTTTVEILEGYRTRTGGDVSVLGHDPERGGSALKACIGSVPQSSSGVRSLTARELVEMYSGYYPHPRPADETLELVGLSGQAGTRARRLSGGQRRRLELAIALGGDPELLFLDEPTTGFDPSARRDAWAMLRDEAAAGRTVLLTTHYMDEADALADRIAVLVDGAIVEHGAPAEVIARQSTETRVRIRLPAGAPHPPEAVGLEVDAQDASVLTGTTREPRDLLHQATGWAIEAGVALEEIEVVRPSLEDVYLALTGRPQDEGTGVQEG